MAPFATAQVPCLRRVAKDLEAGVQGYWGLARSEPQTATAVLFEVLRLAAAAASRDKTHITQKRHPPRTGQPLPSAAAATRPPDGSRGVCLGLPSNTFCAVNRERCGVCMQLKKPDLHTREQQRQQTRDHLKGVHLLTRFQRDHSIPTSPSTVSRYCPAPPGLACCVDGSALPPKGSFRGAG